MTALWFVDTNVLLYNRDRAEQTKRATAAAWLGALWKDQLGRLSYQVLIEYYANATRVDARLSPEHIRDDVRALLLWDPVPPGPQLLEVAWQVHARHSISWWDALIVAAAKSAGCSHLLSEDFQDGQDFGNLLVVDPFVHTPESLLTS